MGTQSQGHEDQGVEAFTSQYCTMTFSYLGDGEVSENITTKNIPRGGAYWMEDIIANLGSVCVNLSMNNIPLSSRLCIVSQDKNPPTWTSKMNQRVGICIPSGCTQGDIERNYRDVYETVSSQLTGKFWLRQWTCVTDDFKDEYQSFITSNTSWVGRIIYL